MPTYEYTCRDCGHTFDIVQSMWDESLTMCPECGGSLRKVFAPPAISFKGSGFYATDHGKKATKSAGDGEKSDKSDKGEKSEPKKEAASEGTKKEPRNGASSGSSDAPKTSPSSSSGKSSDAGGSGS